MRDKKQMLMGIGLTLVLLLIVGAVKSCHQAEAQTSSIQAPAKQPIPPAKVDPAVKLRAYADQLIIEHCLKRGLSADIDQCSIQLAARV